MNNKLLVKDFWNYFLSIKDIIIDIDSLDNKQANDILLDLDKKLKQYSEGIDFILSDLTDKGRNLLFTANGDKDFFEDIIELVQNAPIMDFISVTAFLQPEGKNQTINYDEHIILKSKDLFFLPLETDTKPDKIGIQIAGKYLANNDDNLSATYLLCEKMIGEYDAAIMIDYFDIVDLPNDYITQGFLPLDYLPDFISWKNEQIENKN